MSITAHTDPNDHDNRSAGSSQSTAFQRFQQSLSFELDPFQIEGCQALEEGRGVLVCAPTGAGKTIVGEFAVALAKEQGVRCIYTTPIKALSNQKFHDLQAYGEVGLLTGDVSINPDADIVVMTTEVLRNMLYAGSPTLERLGFVVMDEIHYLADPSRGAVWEEVILNLPDTVQIIGLSATVSNSEEFGDWLRTVRGDTRVVVTDNRPVPLDQWMMAGQKIYPMFSKGEPNPQLRSLHGSSRVNRPAMIRALGEMGMLPAIDFIFSRAGCDDALFDCLRSKISLTSKEEAAQIATIIDEGIEDIDAADLKVLNFPRLRQALMRGFAAHHAGMLPAFKHIVEKLFVRGLVKVVFATETLALGINMPARTVVIEKLTKFNGDSHVELTPAQYTQLTGRAGRRGIDTIGNAVVMWHPRQDPTSVAGLASTRTYPLESTFTPGYNMSVNLINTIGYVHARGLIEQSFAQYQIDGSVVDKARRIEQAKAKKARSQAEFERLLRRASSQAEDDAHNRGNAQAPTVEQLEAYAQLRQEISTLERTLAKDSARSRKAEAAKILARADIGDVIALPVKKGSMLGVVVRRPRSQRDPEIMIITEDGWVGSVVAEDFPIAPRIVGAMSVAPEVLNNPRRRKGSIIKHFARTKYPRPKLNKLKAPKSAKLTALREALRAHPVHNMPGLEPALRAAQKAAKADREVAWLEEQVSEAHNGLGRTFDAILELLEHWGYVSYPEHDEDSPTGAAGEDAGPIVTEEGHMLARIHNESDLLIAQCIRRGIFDPLDPAELAALASVCVFEKRRETRGRAQAATPAINTAISHVFRIWEELVYDEQRLGLKPTREPEPSFALAMHQWTAGAPLDYCLQAAAECGAEMTAGDFVRQALRVVDLLEQMAAFDSLREPARQAVDAIRRGVVAL